LARWLGVFYYDPSAPYPSWGGWQHEIMTYRGGSGKERGEGRGGGRKAAGRGTGMALGGGMDALKSRPRSFSKVGAYALSAFLPPFTLHSLFAFPGSFL